MVDCAEDVKRKSPLELFDALYQTQNNQSMSDTQRAYVQKLMEEIEEENA